MSEHCKASGTGWAPSARSAFVFAFAALAAIALVLGPSAAAATPPPKPAVAAAGEPPITTPGPDGDYLRAMHTAIHWRWAVKFIEDVASKRSKTDELNNPKLQAEVLFTVRWDGSPAEVTLTTSSGVLEFDQAAIAAVKGDRPYPVPPIDTYGDDGVAHFRWVFARDQRLCSRGEVRRVEAPLQDALPRLFVQGRTKEALLRVVRYARGGDAGAMSSFARAWLARPFSDPMLDARAAAALAHAGVSRQADRLRPALARPDTVAVAAPALAALKVDLCALVRPALEGHGQGAWTDPESATRVLLAAGAELAEDSPCAAAILALAKDDGKPPALRADMLQTLATLSPSGVRHLALQAVGDASPRLRAAGALALARPGGGRPTLYRLQPLLKDPSIEVRAAAAAGMVRACGDLADEYLLPLFKSRETQPLAAMAPELGKSTSAGSLDLLLKMQKRNEPALRAPVFAALASRTDAAGRAAFQPLAEAVRKDPYASHAARLMVYADASAEELAPLAQDPLIGILAYKALLRAQRQPEAMDWLVAAFDRLPPETLIDAFGAWLATPTTHLSTNNK